MLRCPTSPEALLRWTEESLGLSEEAFTARAAAASLALRDDTVRAYFQGEGGARHLTEVAWRFSCGAWEGRARLHVVEFVVQQVRWEVTEAAPWEALSSSLGPEAAKTKAERRWQRGTTLVVLREGEGRWVLEVSRTPP